MISQNSELSFLKSILREYPALVVLGITCIGYFVNLLAEMSYLRYFGAGEDTARVQIESLIPSVAGVGILFAISAYLFYILLRRTVDAKSVIKKLIHFFLFYFATSGVVGYAIFYAIDPGRALILTIVLSLIPIVISIILTIFLVLLKIIYEYLKTRLWDTKPSIKNRAGVKPFPVESLGIMYIVITILSLISFTVMYGVSEARDRDAFKLIDISGQSALIIREYGDNAIAMKYNRVSNTLSNKFYYVSLDGGVSSYSIIKKAPKFDINFRDRIRH